MPLHHVVADAGCPHLPAGVQRVQVVFQVIGQRRIQKIPGLANLMVDITIDQAIEFTLQGQ